MYQETLSGPVGASDRPHHPLPIQGESKKTKLLYCDGYFKGYKVKVKFSHTRYRALGPELIPVYRQSARR